MTGKASQGARLRALLGLVVLVVCILRCGASDPFGTQQQNAQRTPSKPSTQLRLDGGLTTQDGPQWFQHQRSLLFKAFDVQATAAHHAATELTRKAAGETIPLFGDHNEWNDLKQGPKNPIQRASIVQGTELNPTEQSLDSGLPNSGVAGTVSDRVQTQDDRPLEQTISHITLSDRHGNPAQVGAEDLQSQREAGAVQRAQDTIARIDEGMQQGRVDALSVQDKQILEIGIGQRAGASKFHGAEPVDRKVEASVDREQRGQLQDTDPLPAGGDQPHELDSSTPGLQHASLAGGDARPLTQRAVNQAAGLQQSALVRDESATAGSGSAHHLQAPFSAQDTTPRDVLTQTPPEVWLYSLLAADYEGESLLPHFLQHYERLGTGRETGL